MIQRLFGEAKARVDHVSSQFSQNGGVMIQVAGTLFRRVSEIVIRVLKACVV